MNWRKPSAYAQLSTCERYSVAKINREGGAMYEVWLTRQHEAGPKLLKTGIKTADEARLIAGDYDGR